MPCDIDTAKQQLRRLSGLRSFPEASEAVTELAVALMAAPSPDAAAQFVTGWIRHWPDTPRPSDVYAAFGRERDVPDAKSLRLHPLCSLCDDTGWQVVERVGLTGVRECICRTASKN